MEVKHPPIIVYRLFDLIFQYVPVYSVEDVRKEYSGMTQEQLAEEMNGQSGLDIVAMTDEISDIAVEAFRRFVSTFEFLDMKKRDVPK
jgi:hypothetical protein